VKSVESQIVQQGTNRRFYGWFSLSGALLVILVTGGVFVYTYGVFLPVMCSDMDWSRGQVSLGLSLGMLMMGLPSPLFGYLVGRFGSKINLILGNSLAGLCLAGMALAQQPWHIYLLLIVAGLGAGIGGYVCCSNVVNNWFVKKRALAMGIFTTGAGLGGFCFPPLATLLISSIGWRLSWVVLGGTVVICVGVIGGVLLVRNKPEDMGQVPDGFSPVITTQGGEREQQSEPSSPQNDWKTGNALRNPVTWLIIIFVGVNSLVLGFVTGHQVAYIQDRGFSPIIASTTVSLVSIFNMVGSLAFGALALKFGSRRLAIAGLAVMAAALVFQFFAGNLGLIYLYSCLIGIGVGLLLAVMPTIVGEYYGRASYAQIFGVVVGAQYVIQSLSNAGSGFIHDATSSYTIVFIILAVAGAIGLACAYLAKKPRSFPDKAGASQDSQVATTEHNP
jgi:MFS transporter, OFA family, oxalate/formate antiporter